MRLIVPFAVLVFLAGLPLSADPNPAPVISSIAPAVFVSSAAPQTVTLTGQNFITGAAVSLENLDYGTPALNADQVTVVSSTTITFVVHFQTTSPLSWMVVVTNPPPAFSGTGMHLEMDPQLSDATPVIFENGAQNDIGYDAIVHARVTPHSTAYLVYGGGVPIPLGPVSGKSVASDDDGDGIVEFDLDTSAGSAVFYVVDSTGFLRRATPGVLMPAPPVPAPDIEVGPNGAVSRIVAEAFSALTLWVRPGVGAWSAGVTDGTASDPDVPFRNGRINVLTSIFQPLGASSGPSEAFAPSDVIVLLGHTLVGNSPVEASGTLPSPLTGTAGGGTIHVTFEGAVEGSPELVYLERWGGASGSISTAYRTVDGTAISGINYVSTAGTVTFATGEYVKAVSIPTIDDGVYDVLELFALELTPHGTTDDSTQTAQIFLTNHDNAPSLSISDVRVDEGDSGTRTVNVPVTLTGRTRAPVSVSWRANDNTGGSLQFAVGETYKTIPITYTANTIPQPDRSVQVSIGATENASIARSTATVTILDDDIPHLSVNDVDVDERSPAAFFTVSLVRPALTTVTVHYATVDGTATAPADYTATNGMLTFAPGEVTKSVAVSIVDDALPEANETFSLNLTQPGGGAMITQATGIATIIDASAPPLPVVHIDDILVTEGNSGTTAATFNVTLSQPSSTTVAVSWETQDVTADSSDYVAAAGTLLFAPGETSKSITVQIIGDTIAEPNETFRLNVTSVSGAVAGDGATCTILDDDSSAPPVPPRRRAAHH